MWFASAMSMGMAMANNGNDNQHVVLLQHSIKLMQGKKRDSADEPLDLIGIVAPEAEPMVGVIKLAKAAADSNGNGNDE
jgi:hypothetical protein